MFKKLRKTKIAVRLLSAALIAAISFSAMAGEKKVKIGLSMDTLKEERWQKDRDIFVKKAEALGAEVLVQAANGNAILQNSQAENLITKGVDILVVVPQNSVTAARIVEMAHQAGVKVISYDRLIRNAEVDLYISFDNVEVGRMQARYLTEKAPKGNYLLIGGAPTDNNAHMFRKGQMEVLKPLIDKGDINIVADQWAKNWQASEALKHTENALTRTNDNIQAIVASNDGTAGGSISALRQQKLAGKVLVSGQDADLAACQRIVEGSQAMTVYKPIKNIARRAAEVAVEIAKTGNIPETQSFIDNGKKKVASILLDPVAVDKSNIMSTVVKDSFHSLEAVYQNMPKEKWPNLSAAGSE